MVRISPVPIIKLGKTKGVDGGEDGGQGQEGSRQGGRNMCRWHFQLSKQKVVGIHVSMMEVTEEEEKTEVQLFRMLKAKRV